MGFLNVHRAHIWLFATQNDLKIIGLSVFFYLNFFFKFHPYKCHLLSSSKQNMIVFSILFMISSPFVLLSTEELSVLFMELSIDQSGIQIKRHPMTSLAGSALIALTIALGDTGKLLTAIKVILMSSPSLAAHTTQVWSLITLTVLCYFLQIDTH